MISDRWIRPRCTKSHDCQQNQSSIWWLNNSFMENLDNFLKSLGNFKARFRLEEGFFFWPFALWEQVSSIQSPAFRRQFSCAGAPILQLWVKHSQTVGENSKLIRHDNLIETLCGHVRIWDYAPANLFGNFHKATIFDSKIESYFLTKNKNREWKELRRGQMWELK